MTDRLLALDLGSSLGWALDGLDGQVRSGALDCGTGSIGERLQAFHEHLLSLLWHEPQACWYERPHCRSDAARTIIYGQQGILLRSLFAHRIPAHRVSANALKKWATGSGRAGKLHMLARAHQIARVGQCVIEWKRKSPPFCGCAIGAGPGWDDRADALCLLGYGGER